MVKRYEVSEKYIGTGEYVGQMVACSDGDYVEFSDYDALAARLAECEAERTGTIHESWQHKTHAELLEGLKWQGAITKSLLASNDELQAWLAEAKGLLEEIGDEWPAVKRTTVERAYAFIERATDSAEPRKDAAHG